MDNNYNEYKKQDGKVKKRSKKECDCCCDDMECGSCDCCCHLDCDVCSWCECDCCECI